MLGQRVRQLVGEQLVENDAQCINIGAGVDRHRIGRNLLGTHVGQRAQQLADVGLPRHLLGIAVHDPGQAEVQDFRLATLVDQDVAGLQVAMNNAALVRVLHRIADFDHQRQSLPRVELRVIGVVDEGLAVDDLHGKVRFRDRMECRRFRLRRSARYRGGADGPASATPARNGAAFGDWPRRS